MTDKLITRRGPYGINITSFRPTGERLESLWHSEAPQWFEAPPLSRPSTPSVMVIHDEQLRPEIEDVRARLLALEADTARRHEQRRLWKLADLERAIRQFALASEAAQSVCSEIVRLLERLHTLCVDYGIECLRDPQIDASAESGVEIAWFNKAQGRAISFSVLPEDDPEGRVWMVSTERGRSALSIYDPTDDTVVEHLRRYAGL